MIRRIALLAFALMVPLSATATSSWATSTSPRIGNRHAAGPSATGVVEKKETITREFLESGHEVVIDKRTVTLRVSNTSELRGRQEIDVSWSGAHPTGGIVADQNSIDAQQEEYPFVLLECRGVASSTAKPSQQITPKTCWTQNWSEHYQDSFQSTWPPYQMDQFATPAERAQVVGAPNPLPKACEYLPAPTQHWVPFIAADGETYYGGPAGCAGQPPEAENIGTSALPSNETFGVTDLNGRGSADFDVFTAEENESLGCSQDVPCALVAVPIMGIGCDPAAAALPVVDRPAGTAGTQAIAACEATGAFAPGQLVNPQGQEDLTVSGSLWWSASNWQNRIVVPLTFAVPASACQLVTPTNTIDVYGSELMIQATSQWEPHLCLNRKLFSFVHVQTGEPEARNLLATGQSEAAFTSYSQPGGYGRPVVNAPVALTGFAISYVIDGANGQPYTHLRLTPLLLAKLLTESYPAILPVQEEDPALAHNPLNITLDPEFQQLNPGIIKGVAASEAASELVALSSDSDVMEALTTYINDNPQARAWLNGKPDPWGMVVNPAYRGIKLPVDNWPLLSTFEPKTWYASDNNDCLYRDPVPYLPLVAAPLATLEEISEALQFSDANSATDCSQVAGTTLGEKLVAQGQQTVGYRFMIGVTPLADDARYGLRAAALESSHSTFVLPDSSSLKVAASLLKPDVSTGTWPVPYETLRSAKGRAAYPGTMVVYAAVPTSGLPKIDAVDFGEFLRFAVTSGQDPGYGVGQLPPGYLPLTARNGLGTLARYTLVAADEIADENGKLPSMTDPVAPVVVKQHAAPPPPPPTTTTTTTQPPPPTTTTTQPPVTQHKSGPPAPPYSLALGRTLPLGVGSDDGVVLLLILIGLIGLASVGALTGLGHRRRK